MNRVPGTCTTVTKDLTFVSFEYLEDEGKEGRDVKLLKEKMIENSPNLVTETYKIQETESIPKSINSKKFITRYITNI